MTILQKLHNEEQDEAFQADLKRNFAELEKSLNEFEKHLPRQPWPVRFLQWLSDIL